MLTRDSLEHIAFRVRLSTVIGAAGGTLNGMYRGHHMVLRTAGLTAVSCALAATACFATERVVHTAIGNDSSLAGLAISHTVAGALGGSFLGFLYQQRPLKGAVLFTPLMLLVATAEASILQVREEKQAEHFERKYIDENR